MTSSLLRAATLAVTLAILAGTLLARPMAGQSAGVRIEVTLDRSLPAQPAGRLLVVLAPSDRVEPRHLIGEAGPEAAPVVAIDAPALDPGASVTLDAAAAAFPIPSLADLPAGAYHVQAVLSTNRDIRSPGAPGNLVSEPVRVVVDPARPAAMRVTLTRRIPDDPLPPDEEQLRFISLRSDLLSRFHGRPIFLRAGIILPRDYDQEPDRRYPLRVRIGGYGARYTETRAMMRPGSSFRAAWLADDAPRAILLHLDGAGPYGDPYQVNSANNGPYGDAITRELIPYVERMFRAIGSPRARVLDGESTGGWVSLALQLFYPDDFNGAWASCPDSVDFRAFQLIDIYGADNAYLDTRGGELPSARRADGSVRFTVRREVRMENVLGLGNSWAMSGEQWGAWNAAYGPRGEDGRPVPLWDPATGVIDRSVIPHWERYDLRRVLERNWDQLAPKLHGALNIWVGERDDYYLDRAVRLFDAWLRDRPSIDARIAYGPGRGHCWTGISPAEMLREMDARSSASTR